MERGELIKIKKWIGLPKDDHTWAFYYYLKRSDNYEVKKRVRRDKVDIITKEIDSHESL
jgi:hypothetical protein